VGDFRLPSILPLGDDGFVQASEVLDWVGMGRVAARERKEITGYCCGHLTSLTNHRACHGRGGEQSGGQRLLWHIMSNTLCACPWSRVEGRYLEMGSATRLVLQEMYTARRPASETCEGQRQDHLVVQAFHQTDCVHVRDCGFGHAINGLRYPGIHRSKHGTKAGGTGSQDRVIAGTLIRSSISTNT
jgi:hypothetical protein